MNTSPLVILGSLLLKKSQLSLSLLSGTSN